MRLIGLIIVNFIVCLGVIKSKFASADRILHEDMSR